MVFEVVSNTCGLSGPLQQPARCHNLQAATCSKGHECTRFCSFEHVLANVFTCKTSGKTHICDSTCEERIQLDSHTSVCRLSKRVFSQAPAFEVSRYPSLSTLSMPDERPAVMSMFSATQAQCQRPLSDLCAGVLHPSSSCLIELSFFAFPRPYVLESVKSLRF